MAVLNVGFALLFQATRAEAGYDFHTYWYYGHFLRQGRDPYYPFLHNPDTLTLPVTYLDGVVVDKNPVRNTDRSMSMAPAYTAPLLFFFSLFSWFSWRPAELLWFAFNLVFLLAAPFLLMRLPPPEQRLAPGQQALVALAFFGLSFTRVTLQNGQVGLFLLVLIFAALALMERAPLASALLLGLALSKYSFALPAFVLFVLMRKFRIALLALAVQALGILAISMLPGGSLSQTFEASWVLFTAHGAQEGINLSARLLAGSAWATPILIALGALVSLLLGYWLWRSGWLRQEHRTVTLPTLYVFNVLILLTVLIAYHRDYDLILILVLLVLCADGFARGGFANLSSQARLGLQIFLGALLVAFIGVANLPTQQLALISPAAAERWSEALRGLLSLLVTYALTVSLWLLYRVYPLKRNTLPS